MRTLLMLSMLVLLSTPALAQDDAGQGVVGDWLLVGLMIDGETRDGEELGNRRIVFTADGGMQSWEKDKMLDKGFYELGEDGKLTAYRDRNGNGVLDANEKAEPQEMTWTREGDVLTMTMPMKPAGNKPGPILVATLELVQDAKPDDQ